MKREDDVPGGGMKAEDDVLRALEAVLFIADEPLPTADLALLFELPAGEVEALLGILADRCQAHGRGVVLRRVAGGWRLATHPDTAPYLERFVGEHRAGRLTQAALETLAIVAYRQPISRIQLAEIRGVSCDAVMRTLLSRGMVKEVGRDQGPGQAILYGTTTYFLERLGLDSVDQLPPLAEFMPDAESVERMESGLGPGL
ncbi:MAG TPA: SMC-Scp complex subunit ScpB [Actinomycetota bacterium]|jgi:segregation and condensation protein B|nr:SMC-Scp complex subunit ScpB [Actinomycetota bacterium]